MEPGVSIFKVEYLFYPADGGTRYLQNVGTIVPNYSASHPQVTAMFSKFVQGLNSVKVYL
jgi:hypothetical protein